jgi:hypothetical protein
LGGLLAAEPATLFVVPALYSLIAGRSRGRDAPNDNSQAKANEAEVPAER